ncbi:unnamed protein product [Arabis nemorensis]|uniref:NB-ARC domain-containing protein n=1 Tax=Arabis nemorensis TaxID=586526 RepID=A0A565C0M5_9BRAS|nr:unnamed protein product [Arabis nemorensis]
MAAAAVTEGVVSFGVQKLWELLSRESERLQGVHEKADGLKCQVEALQSFLIDADAKKHESERVRNILENVKDIVDDAEDIIESFLLKDIKEKGIKKRVKKFSCFLVDRRKFAKDIESITERISAVIAQLKNFGIIQKIDGGRSLSLQERQRVQREIRETFPENSKKGLVGVEQSVEELVGHLVENDNIQVISISGMGGIGKTTLARQVFHHDIVRRHFDGFAWVCVSQEFTRLDIWQRILQDLRPHDGNIKQMDAHTLQTKLFQLLEKSRYLIVLDDVWKNEDWDRIKAVFPLERGSKIVLTSRNEGVGLHAHPKCFGFRPRILTPEESWNLLESVVFPRRDETGFSVDEELKGVGKKMVTHCGGLPLAVKVLGGLLANKRYTVSEWNRVYENIGTQVLGNSGLDDKNLNSVYRILSLSYDELPTQLKHCFLYLAHFPEDSKIDLEKLFHYWAAEGIITSVCNGATIRESGEDYLEELVRRNMVVAGKSDDWSWRWDYCQMHDIMREVCLSKAKEENFLQVIKASTSSSTINAHNPTRSRRLVVQSGNALDMLGRKNNQKARSVLCFGLEGNLWKQAAQGIRSLQLLRVLDLSQAQFEGGILPSSIGELIHLRYLSLYLTRVTHIPSSLRNLKLLLYLNLQTFETIHVPNIFKAMVELRYLCLPLYLDSNTKLELGNLVNLEYLWGFPTKQGNVTDLLGMTRLRALYVAIDGNCTSETLQSSLRELRNLERFQLADRNRPHGGAYQVDFVGDFIHLRDLTLFVHMARFPDQSRFPPNLANISLRGCRIEEDPLPILEKLLHLKSAELLKGAFVGRRMVCSKGGFPQLCELYIFDLNELEEWVVEEGSMPCLRTLTIDYCKKLKEVPDGMKYITSLKKLVIVFMTGWKKKLVPGGESYYKVQHIPDVEFEYWDDDE